jgi:hypothetical protein
MDTKTLNELSSMFKEASHRTEWKAALDILFVRLRSVFIFDNVAVFTRPAHKVAWCRAVGRGKSAEADAAWGESTASEVIAQQSMVLVEPGSESQESNRLKLAISWGCLAGRSLINGVVFIRLAVRVFERAYELAELLALWASSLLAQEPGGSYGRT